MSDFLFALAQWIRTTPLLDLSLWLSNSAMCQWLQSNFLAIPLFQSAHIVSIAVVFGSTLMVNFKILGLTGGSRTVDQVVARYQRWIWGGLSVLILTGVVLLVSEPIRNLINGVFWVKMALLLTATLVGLWFQGAVRKKALAGGDAAVTGDVAIKVGAVVLIILWCLVITGGRWIAYAPA
jgi:hypothetical protein